MVGWAKTDDMLPLSALIEHGTNTATKILCIRRGDREIFVWNPYVAEATETFKRQVLAWAYIWVPKELRP
jgi:hypothetical protein